MPQLVIEACMLVAVEPAAALAEDLGYDLKIGFAV